MDDAYSFMTRYVNDNVVWFPTEAEASPGPATTNTYRRFRTLRPPAPQAERPPQVGRQAPG